MQVEVAKFSHIGNRAENQDMVEVLIGDHTVLGIVIDGMGGHSAGAEAARVSVATIAERFRNSQQPLPFPERFLVRAVAEAHDALVQLGSDDHLDDRPRATCALCLVQGDVAYWAHVGDSRIYHLRGGKLLQRTRDHTHVEMLLQEGLIEESEIASHPMRSYVDQCLGGEASRPTVSVAGPMQLERDDIVLACSDGVWGGARDHRLAGAIDYEQDQGTLEEQLEALVNGAVTANSPSSDNASAVAIRWVDSDPN
ncbi:MAG: protein phosphatase 2C domain-containing protein [Gammaproteobacteria bacterium]|nr:protein phosphatase 2C domain-containing protein [Gammaproteobacteria bacterium]